MIIFLDDILNGDIQALLGDQLYAETAAFVVKWLAILPAIGIILMFALLVCSLFRSKN